MVDPRDWSILGENDILVAVRCTLRWELREQLEYLLNILNGGAERLEARPRRTVLR